MGRGTKRSVMKEKSLSAKFTVDRDDCSEITCHMAYYIGIDATCHKMVEVH